MPARQTFLRFFPSFEKKSPARHDTHVSGIWWRVGWREKGSGCDCGGLVLGGTNKVAHVAQSMLNPGEASGGGSGAGIPACLGRQQCLPHPSRKAGAESPGDFRGRGPIERSVFPGKTAPRVRMRTRTGVRTPPLPKALSPGKKFGETRVGVLIPFRGPPEL